MPCFVRLLSLNTLTQKQRSTIYDTRANHSPNPVRW